MLCTCLRTVLRTSTLRPASLPSTSRLIHVSATSRSAAAVTGRLIPEKRDGMSTPAEFLSKIGRSMTEHEGKVGATWEDFWTKKTEELKEAGIAAPKERKYILRQMEYYRQGRPIREIKAKPKKKFRGRGPRVQRGVRVR